MAVVASLQIEEVTGSTVANRTGSRKQIIGSGRKHRAGIKKQSSSLAREPQAGSRVLSSRSGKGKESKWHLERLQG